MPLRIRAAMLAVRSHHLSEQLLGRNLLLSGLSLVRFQDRLVVLLVSHVLQNLRRASVVIVGQILLSPVIELVSI